MKKPIHQNVFNGQKHTIYRPITMATKPLPIARSAQRSHLTSFSDLRIGSFTEQAISEMVSQCDMTIDPASLGCGFKDRCDRNCGHRLPTIVSANSFRILITPHHRCG